jgi:DNA-binding beta-propeller fold protein YncE
VVTTAGDGTVRLADADAKSVLRTLATTDASPQHLRVSPDGRRVAVCADGVLIIDVEHGDVLLRARVLADQPYDLTWTPDGERLIVTDCPGGGVVLDTRPLREVLAAERESVPEPR